MWVVLLTAVTMVIEIVFGIIGIAFFTYLNSTGGQVPYIINLQSRLQHVRLFTDNFLRYIPLIMALAGLDLARNVTLFVLGYNSALSNWWQICTQGAQAVMMAFMIRSGLKGTIAPLRLTTWVNLLILTSSQCGGP